MKNIFVLTYCYISFSNFILANIVNIPADTSTIQGGIFLANNGDTVLVQPATYQENINFIGKKIKVGSLTILTGDTSYISQTLIDGNHLGSVVTFANGEDSTAELNGFTITHGFGYNGGGIYIINASPTLTNLLVLDNMAVYGGGIQIKNSKSRFSHVNVLSNRAVNVWISGGDGGGIYCSNSNPILYNMLICDNYALELGGGIIAYASGVDCAVINLSNVTIKMNSAGSGGGIALTSQAQLSFDDLNLCNIFLNQAKYVGSDLYNISDTIIAVIVDTFTVLRPDSSHAYPLRLSKKLFMKDVYFSIGVIFF
jgi:hypothetical protein